MQHSLSEPARAAVGQRAVGNHTSVLAGDWLYMEAFQVARASATSSRRRPIAWNWWTARPLVCFRFCARRGAVVSFQFVDDLLDFASREKVLGKQVGNDLREGRVTLPLVYALEQASGEERRRVETILRDRNYDRMPFPQILAMVGRYGGIARVKERAQAFTEKARGIIGEFPESPYQRALYSVTELVTERDH